MPPSAAIRTIFSFRAGLSISRSCAPMRTTSPRRRPIFCRSTSPDPALANWCSSPAILARPLACKREPSSQFQRDTTLPITLMRARSCVAAHPVRQGQSSRRAHSGGAAEQLAEWHQSTPQAARRAHDDALFAAKSAAEEKLRAQLPPARARSVARDRSGVDPRTHAVLALYLLKMVLGSPAPCFATPACWCEARMNGRSPTMSACENSPRRRFR